MSWNRQKKKKNPKYQDSITDDPFQIILNIMIRVLMAYQDALLMVYIIELVTESQSQTDSPPRG